MKVLNYSSGDFWNKLDNHLSLREVETSSKIDADVKSIIADIKKYGDDKIIQYAKDFDNITLSIDDIKLQDLKKFYSFDNLNKDTLESFRLAIKNVEKFHEKQFPQDYEVENMDTKLKSVWKPIDSVGLYIPGGNAVYPSSLIMSVVPAQIAGVKRIVCVTPPCDDFNPYIAFLLDELNISEVFQVGEQVYP